MSIYRYTITRLCLLEGSLRLQKNIAPLFASLEGEITLRDERGIEFSAQISQKESKLWGLGEYYKRTGLGVNDVLSLGRLEERKFQLEAIIKHARVSSAPSAPLLRPVAPQRVVLGETEFLREVRVERPRSSLLGMPSREARETKEAREAASAGPDKSGKVERPSARADSDAVAPVSQAPETRSAQHGQHGQVTEVRTDSSKPEALSVDVGGRRYVPILPQKTQSAPPASAQPVQPVQSARADRKTPSGSGMSESGISSSGRVASSVSAPSKPVNRIVPAPTSSQIQDKAPPQPDFGPLERFAVALGYSMKGEGQIAVLEARLGRQSYRVALTSALSTPPDWAALENLEADYRAVLLREDSTLELPTQFKLTRITVEALETLLESTALSPLTPLELRGYWNADAIDQNSAHSLAEMAGRELGSRGVFSQVLLCLTEFEPHSSIRVSHLIHRLGERVKRSDLESILDTLTRPPLLAISHIGEGEYYLRQSVQDTLTLLSDYALGLGARVRVSKTPTQLNGTKRDLLEV